jgi:hypothetical protein
MAQGKAALKTGELEITRRVSILPSPTSIPPILPTDKSGNAEFL